MKKTLFYNCKVYSSNENAPLSDAFIVEDKKITWVGVLENLPSENDITEKVDLQGRRVLPAFIDSHMHPIILAEFSRQISALPPKVNSIKDLIDEIRKVRESQGRDKWILGWGYDEGKFAEHRPPTRYDLDKGAEDAPVCITRTCVHIKCVNSKALELAGIDRNTKDPEGGEIERDENGEPTGILKENARNLLAGVLPETTKEDHIENLLNLDKILLSQGIVAVTDMANLDQGDYYSIYNDAVKEGFKQRVSMYYLWDYYYKDKDYNIPMEHRDKNKQIFVSGLKLIGDGSVSGHTAWMSRHYLGSEDDYGMPVCSDEQIDTAVEFCKKEHMQLSMHAMGDKTIARVVDRVYDEEPWVDDVPYIRLEHLTYPSDDSVNKMVEKGIANVTQPIFLYSEIESYLNNLGEEWTKETYPVASMLSKGAIVSLSSDAPATAWATPSDPMPGIKCAVTRLAYNGQDCGQQEKVTIRQAIDLYTKEAAKVCGFKDLGEIKEGYRGSFIVLDRDILTVKDEDIDKVKVLKTYVDGSCEYSYDN